VHLSASIGRLSFGLGPVACQLAAWQARSGWCAQVWSLDDEAEISWVRETGGYREDMFHTFHHSGPAFLGFAPRLERFAARRGGSEVSIVHQHGVWTALSRVTLRWGMKFGRPSVVAAHGSLDPWALKRSGWKKRLALLGYERDNLRRAACLHALSTKEYGNYRDFGLDNPVAVIPNGIDEKWIGAPASPERFRQRLQVPADVRVILFLSRITPKKGLPMLVDAVAELCDQLRGWRVVIAGGDEFGHEREVKARVAKLGLSDLILFAGPLFGQAKCDAVSAADLFVLPSHSEGAPMVILEAMGRAVPVLATRASPWPELVSHDCGWWCDISVDAIGASLSEAVRKAPGDLAAMGRRGLNLVRTKYTWAGIAKTSIDLYEWLLGRRPQPDCVVTR
jgi:glycosyltransferase involved in cell wall biosynthesis